MPESLTTSAWHSQLAAGALSSDLISAFKATKIHVKKDGSVSINSSDTSKDSAASEARARRPPLGPRGEAVGADPSSYEDRQLVVSHRFESYEASLSLCLSACARRQRARRVRRADGGLDEVRRCSPAEEAEADAIGLRPDH